MKHIVTLEENFGRFVLGADAQSLANTRVMLFSRLACRLSRSAAHGSLTSLTLRQS